MYTWHYQVDVDLHTEVEGWDYSRGLPKEPEKYYSKSLKIDTIKRLKFGIMSIVIDNMITPGKS